MPISGFARAAAYPSLLDNNSIDAALANLPSANEGIAELQARVSALQIRASRLAATPVITAAERAQMQSAIRRAR